MPRALRCASAGTALSKNWAPADRAWYMRLRWDAKSASATNHPNIVTIHDFGNDGGFDYIVMECVDGLPLGKMIAPGGLPAQTLLQYAIHLPEPWRPHTAPALSIAT